MTDDTRRYTRDEVSAAVNTGIDLVQLDPGLYLSDQDTDLLNLVANVILTVLDDPDASLDDAIARNYDPEYEDDPQWPGEPADGTQESDEQARARIIRTVRSWVS